jgi:enamine deaminase RidA (YjgF/YER057c/UK114 family)
VAIDQTESATSPDARLAELTIDLPNPPEALGSYTPVHIVGDLLYTSGVLPVWNGELRGEGVVGGDMSLPDGVAAARLCGLNILALVREHLGSLDAVRQMVQMTGFVRSGPEFAQQAKVLNGASDLFLEVFGERGRHTRTALGTSELPLGAAVEINAVVRIFPDLVRPRD